jgi:predicted metal-dependent phosphoesterase TrpH
LENFDLHNHSTCSDGLLSPTQLIELAARTGTDAIALTDHDNIDGLAEAEEAARRAGIGFIPGVEISVSWGDTTLHVVGLRVDPASATLRDGLESIRVGRLARAQRISAALDKLGFPATFDAALALAKSERLLSRTHFARHLVERGAARDIQQAFDKYLAKGKPGYVSHRWANLDDAMGWIAGSGGTAVLAHPGRYDLKPMMRHEMLAAVQGPRRNGDRGGDRQPSAGAVRDVATDRAGARVPRLARRGLSRAGREPVRAGAAAAAGEGAHARVVRLGPLNNA